MAPVDFTPGRVFKRAEIHDRYGGQRQYGISTPAKLPLILLFDSPAGEKYGFEDGWSTNGLYKYSGEGQRGDMTFTGGNEAILRHAERGKELHLFVFAGPQLVRYEGEFEYVDHEIAERRDAENNWRKAIVFHLRPVRQ